MRNPPSYLRQKFSIAGAFLKGRQSLPIRVVKAWTEISPLNEEDFDDKELRSDFEWIMSKIQFAVIDGVRPKATTAECEEVARRIEKIRRALGAP